MDGFVHDHRDDARAFLPRHFTRGKDGAPAETVPSLTEDGDRGDGQAVVYNVQPPGESAARAPNTLTAHETDVSEAVTSRASRRSERGTLAVDPVDEGLAERLELEGYLPAVPIDPRPDGPRYAACGDAISVPVAQWIGDRLMAIGFDRSG